MSKSKTLDQLADQYVKTHVIEKDNTYWGRTPEDVALARQSFMAGYRTHEEESGRWIKVNEQLPEEGKWVLRYSPTWGVGVDRLEMVLINNGKKYFYGDEESNCLDASHWMPLPNKPEE